MIDRDTQVEMGIVRATKHYLLSIEGLPSARVHDIVLGEDGSRALVTSLSHDAVEAILLDRTDVRPGQRFELRTQENQMAIGPHLFGRVINALGDPLDGRGGFPPKNAPFVLEREAGGLVSRAAIHEQLVTGFSMIDTVLPIGKGQRQLLMGPVQSGIDVFCRQVMRNQFDERMVCIYASIGKPMAYIERLAQGLFRDSPAGGRTCVIASTAHDPTPLNIVVPSVALYIAEWFCDAGRDILLVLDDLYTHAKYLRELGLLEGRLPGRESYPGDIFYQQAHLIERAGIFAGKGSITLLPVLQTDLESATDLIMTNIMGTTDGHLSFSSALYSQGTFPPVLEEESVTRVGKHTQSVVQKQLSTAVISLLTEAKEQERFSQFGTQLSEATRDSVEMGRMVRALLSQPSDVYLGTAVQAILFGLVFTKFSTGKQSDFFRRNREPLTQAIQMRAELTPLREQVATAPSLEVFLAAIESNLSFFEQVCQQ